MQIYHFTTPSDHSKSSSHPLSSLIKPASPLDHPEFLAFFEGSSPHHDPANQPLLTSVVKCLLNGGPAVWGTSDLGLYCMRSPLEATAGNEILSALRLALPDVLLPGYTLFNKVWHREVGLRHPAQDSPSLVPKGSVTSPQASSVTSSQSMTSQSSRNQPAAQPAVSTPERHKADAKKYYIDAAYFVTLASEPASHPGPALVPKVLVEFALSTSYKLIDKELQLQKYVSNVLVDMYGSDYRGCIYTLNFILSEYGALSSILLCGYFLTRDIVSVSGKHYYALARCELFSSSWPNHNEQQLVGLLSGLRHALGVDPCNIEPSIPDSYCSPSLDLAQRQRHRVIISPHDGTNWVEKYIDNRDHSSARSFVVWLKLNRAKLLFDQASPPTCKADEAGRFLVIRYKYIEGSHVPTSSHQFIAVITDLESLHQLNICHGDIRLANIVFTAPGSASSSQLIDFDLSATVGSPEAVYPAGFNARITDGARHSKALGGAAMLSEHDCHSLAALMRFFQAADQKFEDTWRSACAAVVEGNLAAARDMLAGSDDFPLSALRAHSPVLPIANKGTGSP